MPAEPGNRQSSCCSPWRKHPSNYRSPVTARGFATGSTELKDIRVHRFKANDLGMAHLVNGRCRFTTEHACGYVDWWVILPAMWHLSTASEGESYHIRPAVDLWKASTFPTPKDTSIAVIMQVHMHIYKCVDIYFSFAIASVCWIRSMPYCSNGAPSENSQEISGGK